MGAAAVGTFVMAARPSRRPLAAGASQFAVLASDATYAAARARNTNSASTRPRSRAVSMRGLHAARNPAAATPHRALPVSRRTRANTTASDPSDARKETSRSAVYVGPNTLAASAHT